MKLYTPDYYSRFHCLAQNCPDSCCKEWEIDIDPHTASFYQSLNSPLGNQIRAHLRSDEAGTAMTLSQGRCPMWRRDGLCEIQFQMGQDALCRTCREFPRLRHEYGDFTELGLELSCPEAARLILTEPYAFSQTVTPGGEEPEYDLWAMEILRSSREKFLDFLERHSMAPEEILTVLLLYGFQVQSQLDGGEPAVLEPEADLAEGKRFAAEPDFGSFFSFFQNLEILTPQWKSLLKAPPRPGSWNPLHLALARYLIYRYWYQAVSDYDLMGRIKFIIAACILVKNLGEDTLSVSQLFSKEIENDPDNLDSILDGCYTSPAFTDQNLLSMLLTDRL